MPVNPPDRITVDPSQMKGRPCIRHLSIQFWDVYRELTLHGLSEATVLAKHAELEAEDIAAVRQYAVYLVKSRTHDEITGRPAVG